MQAASARHSESRLGNTLREVIPMQQPQN